MPQLLLDQRHLLVSCFCLGCAPASIVSSALDQKRIAIVTPVVVKVKAEFCDKTWME